MCQKLIVLCSNCAFGLGRGYLERQVGCSLLAAMARGGLFNQFVMHVGGEAGRKSIMGLEKLLHLSFFSSISIYP